MFGTKLTKIINAINTILLPPSCFGCNVHLIRGEELLCTTCRYELPLTDHSFGIENQVDRLFYGRVPIKKACSFLYYTTNGIAKNLLHHLKYKNQEVIGDFFGDWYGSILAEDKALEQIDYVIPVPLHPKKLKLRGYNQVARFGKKLALHLDALFLEDGLVKTSNTKTQTQKSRLLRWQSQQQLFLVKEPEKLIKKRILLVDDIVTTGATLEVCSQTLLEIKGVEIFIATMATVPKLLN